MTERDRDQDTGALIPLGRDATDGTQEKGSATASREGGEPPRKRRNRWHTRVFEFASPEAVVLYTACAVAQATIVDLWPVVELNRYRVRLRLLTGFDATPLERALWAELVAWARRLGGREVAERLFAKGGSRPMAAPRPPAASKPSETDVREAP